MASTDPRVATEGQWEDLVARIKAKAESSDIPTTAAEVGALPDTTKYAADINFTMDSSTFVITAQLKDQDGTAMGTAKTVDIPLESVVVDATYDSTNKKIVLELQNGNTTDVPVGDLVNGLQAEITSSNKLDADLVDDTNSTNKFVTAADITKLNGIEAGAEANVIETVKVNGTALTPDANKAVDVTVPTATSDLTNDSGFLTSIPTASASVLGGVKVGSGLSIDPSTGVLTATGTSMVLYPSTGQNTDGAMTQKAVTDALPAEFSQAEWTALWA